MWYFFLGFIVGLGVGHKFVVEPLKIQVAQLQERLAQFSANRKEPGFESEDSEHSAF